MLGGLYFGGIWKESSTYCLCNFTAVRERQVSLVPTVQACIHTPA